MPFAQIGEAGETLRIYRSKALELSTPSVHGADTRCPSRGRVSQRWRTPCSPTLTAFGTRSMLNDRLKIARNAAYPDTILAPQVLIFPLQVFLIFFRLIN